MTACANVSESNILVGLWSRLFSWSYGLGFDCDLGSYPFRVARNLKGVFCYVSLS